MRRAGRPGHAHTQQYGSSLAAVSSLPPRPFTYVTTYDVGRPRDNSWAGVEIGLSGWTRLVVGRRGDTTLSCGASLRTLCSGVAQGGCPKLAGTKLKRQPVFRHRRRGRALVSAPAQLGSN